MRTRRGSTLWAGPLGDMIDMFKVGDIVKPVTVEDDFTGVVRAVDGKVNKVWVAWGGGSVKQHDPDEIQLMPYADETIRNRYASRRETLSKEATNLRSFAETGKLISRRDRLALTEDEVGPQFVGDPKVHGIDKPRGGGFSIMQNLQKDLAPEALEEAEEGPKIAPQQAGMGEDTEEDGGDQNAPGGDPNASQDAPVEKMAADKGKGSFYIEFYKNGRRNRRFWPTLDEARDVAEKIFKQTGIVVGIEEDKSRRAFEMRSRRGGKIPGVPDGTGPMGGTGECPFSEEDEEIEASSRVALTVPQRHQKNIAIKTLKMNDVFAKVMGGMTKEEAREFLKSIGWSDSRIRRLESSDKTARSREAAAGPYTLMQQLFADFKKGKLEDEEVLKSWGHGMGHTKGADYVVGAGEDIVWVLLGYASGRKDKEDVLKVVRKNIRQALKDNEIFKGLRGEQRELHDKWMEYMEGLRGGRKSSVSTLRSRRAMYWTDKDRVYRLTRMEQDGGGAVCPKCKKEMSKEPFTRSDKLYNCPSCGFKIPSSKVVTERKVEVELEPDGTIEVEVEPVEASLRRGRTAAIEVPDNLRNMSISEIASLIAADWARVNYAAKPYLDAMFSLESVKDMYFQDPGSMIVAYFLSNASSWRGEVAKAVKKELKRRIR